MRRLSFILIATGIVVSSFSAFADSLALGRSGNIGAAQILGIDIGVMFALIGIGLLTVDRGGNLEFGKRIRYLIDKFSNPSKITWVIITFLVVYVSLFVFPVFFSKIKIQYFVKYIPDAWVTHIGFDMDMTLGRVSRWLTSGNSPYSDLYYYAPLTLVIFAPLLVLGYPAYYKLSTIITIISYIISTGLIPSFISPKKAHGLLLLFFITGLFSYGFQFELERGQYNLIAFTVCLVAIYLFHYRPNLRYFAYLLFSLSIQLKLYPVIFTVMFIKDWRDWKNNIKRILGLGIFNFSLLFVLGYGLFADFVRNITGAQLEFQSSRLEDLSIKGFVYNLTTDGFGLIPSYKLSQLARNASWIENTLLILSALCLLSVIVHSYIRKVNGFNPYLLGICTLDALVMPSASVDYKLPLVLAPIILMFCGLPAFQNRASKIISGILIVLASTAYWLTLYPFTVKPYIIARNFPALFVILVSITLLYFLAQGKFEGKPSDPIEETIPNV